MDIAGSAHCQPQFCRSLWTNAHLKVQHCNSQRRRRTCKGRHPVPLPESSCHMTQGTGCTGDSPVTPPSCPTQSPSAAGCPPHHPPHGSHGLQFCSTVRCYVLYTLTKFVSLPQKQWKQNVFEPICNFQLHFGPFYD